MRILSSRIAILEYIVLRSRFVLTHPGWRHNTHEIASELFQLPTDSFGLVISQTRFKESLKRKEKVAATLDNDVLWVQLQSAGVKTLRSLC